jgi:hypothetical protein
MKDLDFTLFGTPIGDCGIVWKRSSRDARLRCPF